MHTISEVICARLYLSLITEKIVWIHRLGLLLPVLLRREWYRLVDNCHGPTCMYCLDSWHNPKSVWPHSETLLGPLSGNPKEVRYETFIKIHIPPPPRPQPDQRETTCDYKCRPGSVRPSESILLCQRLFCACLALGVSHFHWTWCFTSSVRFLSCTFCGPLCPRRSSGYFCWVVADASFICIPGDTPVNPSVDFSGVTANSGLDFCQVQSGPFQVQSCPFPMCISVDLDGAQFVPVFCHGHQSLNVKIPFSENELLQVIIGEEEVFFNKVAA